MARRWGRLILGCSTGGIIALGTAIALASPNGADPSPSVRNGIDFSRDIRPILSENCYLCHGPDPGSRQADLRLDLRQEALAVITPGEPETSELLARVTAHEAEDRMPPVESGKTLSADQIDVLRRWIDQGAEYSDHWSFIAPARPQSPNISDPDWARNAIDHFILARLDSEGLRHAPSADRPTLIRRITFDLTGLPPAPEEVDAFLNDDSPNALDRLIDRLFASPRYGEHMARYWMDAARYGDTHGLHLDNAREIWPWRDWAIDAFQNNMPFDQFTIEQLAGDMLPEPTRDQIIATGFNRNHVSTNEGGVIPAEFQINNVADRLETTSTVWLGMTMGCARCHDHKFDPVTLKEYYELFAFFNNTTENPMDGNRRDWAPILRAPSEEQESQLDEMTAVIEHIKSQLDAPDPEIDAKQEAWRAELAGVWNTGWLTLDIASAASTGGASLRLLDDHSILAEGENPDRDVYELTARTDETGLRLIRLEALTDEGLPFNGPGRAENANFVLSEIEADVVSLDDPAQQRTIRFVAAAADHEQMNGPYPVAAAIDGIVDDTSGWAIEGYNRREDRVAVFVADEPFGYKGGSEIHVRLRFETHFRQHAIGRVRLAVAGEGSLYESVAPIGYGTWHAGGPFTADNRDTAYNQVFGPEETPGAFDFDATFDDGLTWRAEPAWVDGAVHMLEGGLSATYLARTIHAPTARRLALSLGSDDAIKVWLNGHLVHENNIARSVAADQDLIEVDLAPGANTLLMKIVNFGGGYGFYFNPTSDTGGGEFLRMMPLVLADSLDAAQALTLARYFRRNHSPEMQALYEDLGNKTAERDAFDAALPFTLVMKERAERRPTYVLHRGEYDQPRERVEPTVPAALPPMPDDLPHNRLGFAQWLVSPEHPLTARVTVNRLWQQVFGTGIVKTAEDFGSQGQWPSHPELLDWLAVEFMETGWDVQHMLRLMLTSATYRQSSVASPEVLAHDPENRLLARGPRFRMEAEMIRDQALAASGLLVEKVGGPGVRPYQPEGLWKAVAYPDSNTQVFMKDEGEAQYRRSMYTYWKRTSPAPNMAAFDAPSRETCTVRRPRTNTPLQSLVLLNDPQFVEAARNLAQRALVESEGAGDAAVVRAFRLVLSRVPTDRETQILRDLFTQQRAIFADDLEAAAALVSVGDSPRDESLDVADHAALTNVASTILSLDEAVTKG